MIKIEINSWLIGAVIVSIVIAFITSLLETNRKYGTVYVSECIGAWGKIISTLSPLLIYIAISTNSGGWNNIVQSAEIAMGAFLIIFLSCNELGCALSVKRNHPIVRYKIFIISSWSLIWLCISLASVIFIYQEKEISTAVLIGQVVLLIIAILTYFGTAVVVKLVKNGYIPKGSNK